MRTAHTYRGLSLLAGLAASTAMAAAAGCHEDVQQHGETFSDQEHPTSVGLVAQSQAAVGAKADATLYDRHFRGDRLSGLGQGKLDLIAKATAAGEPVQVYLDMSPDLAAARRPAVMACLAADGIPPQGVALADGPNPHATTPSAYNLATIYKDTGEAADLGVTGGLGSNGPGGTVGK